MSHSPEITEQNEANRRSLEVLVHAHLAEHPDDTAAEIYTALRADGFTGRAQSFQIQEAIVKVRPVRTLTTSAEAVQLMADLSARFDDVGVFWDRGWGDSGQRVEISIVVDGDGQAPVAHLTEAGYAELLDHKMIGPNVLETFKARRFHEYAPSGVAL